VADLPWDNFLTLSGSPNKNWEILCREVVRRHYEQFGPLLTRKQQPGVEFHITVERDGGELGDIGRHWGWQCKWYEPDDLRSDGSRLRENRRTKIEKAIKKSDEHVTGLTDWVLWSRDKLSADDSRWFDGLKENAPFTLHHWDEETLVGMLSGSAEVLLKTWFGELVFDQSTLNERRREALAPITHRYIEELHVETPSETVIRAALPDAELATVVRRFEGLLETVRSEVAQGNAEAAVGMEPREAIEPLLDALEAAEAALGELAEELEDGQLPSAAAIRRRIPDEERRDELQEAIDQHRYERGNGLPRDIAHADRVLAQIWRVQERLAERLATPLIAALGRAGAGKTHLAAHLSGPAESARGVLVLGLDFGVGVDDDDVARFSRIAETRDELLEAMEAVGIREGRRVPLVIDGLNEADEPAKLKAPLARLATKIATLPHVVGVVTARPKYRDLALPDEIVVEEIPGLEGVEQEAIERYFAYYKIEADHEAISWWRPSDPLLLSIFCRTVNADRETVVTAEQLPSSLHEVFDAYLADVFGRIAAVMGTEEEEIRRLTLELAFRFFSEGSRNIERSEASQTLGDGERAPHKESLRFQLENEEIISRDVVDGMEQVQWSYDLLAGHLIATAILERHPDREEIAGEDIATKLSEHPLAEDIIAGLGGLLAREGTELVEVLAGQEELVAEAALASARLSGSELGEASAQELSRVFVDRPSEVLEAISTLTLEAEHPLNGRFLDTLLSGMEVWERDLVWTEWVRQRSETVGPQLSELARGLREGRGDIDKEAALSWLTWLLTSTDKRLRDEVIYALYQLGRAAPELLFARVLEMLDVNDPWVAEGLLAAGYGASMAAQDPASDSSDAVVAFAADLADRLLAEDATQPTFHWLIREYAYRINQLAAWLSGGSFEAPTDAVQPPLPQPDVAIERFERGGEGWEAVESAFRMDFSNYTIGHLVEGRSNYEDDHERFLEVTGDIRARVAELGWTAERFGEIDRMIGERDINRGNDPEKLERYGKKYSWVGYFEVAGRLSDNGELGAASDDGGRLSDVPIDPSFPTDAAPLPFELEAWVSEEGEDEEWVRSGRIEIPDELLRTEALGEGEQWVAIDGYLRHQPQGTDRKVFCFIRGILALEGWDTVEAQIAEHGVDNDLVPRNAGDHYCFAGEAPWSPTFDSFYTDADGTAKPNVTNLGSFHEEGPEVELLGVDFEWESYHSALNNAEIGTLPSKHFSFFAGLRKRPERAEYADREDKTGAISVRVSQENWNGHLLYVRQDLLEAYLAERGGEWGWIAWGEREMFSSERRSEPPEWLGEVRRAGDDRFYRVTTLAELGANS
jgi:hypothetical protein